VAISLKYRLRRKAWFDRDGHWVKRRPDDPQCYYCRVVMCHEVPGLEPTVDHKIPRSRGGDNQVANLVWACITCNQLKGTQTAEEFLARLG
jgi:5-methylcytosine-specific restriction endonuclease McrA